MNASKQENSASSGDSAFPIAPLEAHERVAALADSALDEAEAQATIDQMLQSPELCALWHRLHQTNDYLRSEEMAACEGGAEFWKRFSARLEHELPILAPGATRTVSLGRAWLRYGLPGASALAAVAMVAWMIIPQYAGEPYVVASNKPLPQQAPSPAPTQVSDRSVPQLPDVRQSTDSAAMVVSAIPAQPVNPQELRNYLAAHQQFSAGPWRGPVSVQSASFNTIRTDGVNQH